MDFNCESDHYLCNKSANICIKFPLSKVNIDRYNTRIAGKSTFSLCDTGTLEWNYSAFLVIEALLIILNKAAFNRNWLVRFP